MRDNKLYTKGEDVETKKLTLMNAFDVDDMCEKIDDENYLCQDIGFIDETTYDSWCVYGSLDFESEIFLDYSYLESDEEMMEIDSICLYDGRNTAFKMPNHNLLFRMIMIA
jgi:hypothetical protein